MFIIVRNSDLCPAPASSVLFDDVIPKINNSTIIWASKLLTFKAPM